MAKTQIPNLPAGAGLDGTEIIPCRDGAGDAKYTVDQLADFVTSTLTPSEILALVIAASPQINGLNANLLQGQTASFFRDASNLNAGVVPNARLPQGSVSPTWTSGGLFPTEGSLKDAIKIPAFLLGGARYMIQHGWTNFMWENQRATITFKEPFAGGFGGTNRPNVFVTSHCRSSEYPSLAPDPTAEAELIARLHGDPTLSGFTMVTRRLGGNLSDTVRANWWAIGTY